MKNKYFYQVATKKCLNQAFQIIPNLPKTNEYLIKKDNDNVKNKFQKTNIY